MDPNLDVKKPIQTIKTLHKLWTVHLKIQPKRIVSSIDTSDLYAVNKNFQTPSILFEKGSTKIKVTRVMSLVVQHVLHEQYFLA